MIRFLALWAIAAVTLIGYWVALAWIARHFGAGDPHVAETVRRAERYVAERKKAEG